MSRTLRVSAGVLVAAALGACEMGERAPDASDAGQSAQTGIGGAPSGATGAAGNAGASAGVGGNAGAGGSSAGGSGGASGAGAGGSGAGGAGGAGAGGAGGGGSRDAAADAAVRPRKPIGGTFVHLFEWTWSDIAKECRLFLGPKGFSAVQVSPPSEHAILAGNPWWERYQTVGYGLDKSRSGTKAEFADMVSACAAAGVDVYVDAVINHMTGQASGTGSNGTSFQKYQYPGLYAVSDFHRPTCTIAGADYATSAANVQNCELVGLADLDTGAAGVRTKIANYLIALVQIGVRGFRIDAAKHMAAADVDAIVNTVDGTVGPAAAPYYFLEVIDPGGEAVHASDYFDVGRASGSVVGITEFKYGIGSRFLGAAGQRLVDLKNVTEAGWSLLPSDRAVVFVTNHDTQRATAVYYPDGVARDLADVFMLAWPYGYPSIMSGYAFDRASQPGRDIGPPSDASGRTIGPYAASDTAPACAATRATAAPGIWVCEHRARSTANMVAFRGATVGTTVTHWWDNGANQIAFARGDRGFVAINRETTALTRRFETGLPAGTYCDVIAGDFAAGSCSGPTVAVDATGFADLTVGPSAAAALHVAAKMP